MNWATHDLIQRATYTTSGPSLDHSFSWDYMGSSEFEFGTLPRSIRALRLIDEKGAGLVKRRLECDGFEFWFVGATEQIGTALATLGEELGSERVHRKERTQLKAAVTGEGYHGDVDCWVAVNGRLRFGGDGVPSRDVPWFLSLKEEAAATFLRNLRARKVSE